MINSGWAFLLYSLAGIIVYVLSPIRWKPVEGVEAWIVSVRLFLSVLATRLLCVLLVVVVVGT